MKAWRILLGTTIVVSGISESKDSSSVNDDDFEDSQETTSNEDPIR